jgi:hypothetical protein
MHIRRYRLLLVMVWICFCCGLAAADSELSKIFRNTILVLSTREKLQVIPERGQTNGIVEIERVFWGSSEWVGRTFVTTSLTDDPDFRPAEPEAALLKNGAIWAVDVSDPKTPKKGSDFLGSSWPVFTAHNADETMYPRALALAEAMGQVAKAPSEKQITILLSLASSSDPDASPWAIRAIQEAGLKDTSRLLKTLPAQKLPLESQVELDRAFLKLDAKGWLNHTSRLTLFREWVTGAADEKAALKGLMYLGDLANDERPELSSFRTLLEKGFNNGRFSPLARATFLPLLAPLISDKEEAFRFLMEVIEKDAAIPARVAATYALMNHVPGDDGKVTNIRALSDRITDEPVKARLATVLQVYADEKQERAQKVLPPEAVWEEMKRALLKGEIATAMQFFSVQNADAYRKTYQSMSQAQRVSTVQEMGPLSRVERSPNEATCAFKSKLGNVQITFPVHFLKENGQWKILEY